MIASQRMLLLVRSFPTLAELEGTQHGWDHALKGYWYAETFDAWAVKCPGITSASRMAAQFVLAVWSGQAIHLSPPRGGKWDAPPTEWDCPWKVGGFDLMHALKIWDDPHRAAFMDWAKRPWWV